MSIVYELKSNRVTADNIQSKLPYVLKVTKEKGQVNYLLPAICHLKIKRIAEINKEDSTAKLLGVFIIDLKYCDQVERIMSDCEEKYPERAPLGFQMDTQRGFTGIKLPLCLGKSNKECQQWDKEVFQEEDSEYTRKIDKNDPKKLSLIIRTVFTVQIDNTLGRFFAPFNSMFLKLVLTFHKIKISNNCTILINLLDYEDYNPNSYPYTSYTQLEDLQLLGCEDRQAQIWHRKLQRRSKISIAEGAQFGEYSVADNYLFMYPHQKRVVQNSNVLNSKILWILGWPNRQQLIAEYDEEHSIQSRRLQKFQYLHIEVPIYKYPVSDILTIFIPLIIMSVLSLSIFWQANGIKEDDNDLLTTVDTRLINVGSLLIGYVALIPVVRQSIPPTPSFTLIQLLIFLSIFPNVLSLISSFFSYRLMYEQWQEVYSIWKDALFLISFATVISIPVFVVGINVTIACFLKRKIPVQTAVVNKQLQMNLDSKVDSYRFVQHIKRLLQNGSSQGVLQIQSIQDARRI